MPATGTTRYSALPVLRIVIRYATSMPSSASAGPGLVMAGQGEVGDRIDVRRHGSRIGASCRARGPLAFGRADLYCPRSMNGGATHGTGDEKTDRRGRSRLLDLPSRRTPHLQMARRQPRGDVRSTVHRKPQVRLSSAVATGPQQAVARSARARLPGPRRARAPCRGRPGEHHAILWPCAHVATRYGIF